MVARASTPRMAPTSCQDGQTNGPESGPCAIRVMRMTQDSVSATSRNRISWTLSEMRVRPDASTWARALHTFRSSG